MEIGLPISFCFHSVLSTKNIGIPLEKKGKIPYNSTINKNEGDIMNDEIKTNAKNKMIQSLEGLEKRFSTVRAGRANPSSLDGVYG